MAQPPLTYLEGRWASGLGGTGANRLIESGTQNTDRKRIYQLDYDFHRNISSVGRRTLVTLGRWLFWNVDAVRGMVLEAANKATETWVAQFEGEDQTWGIGAEEWIADHNKFCSVRGANHTFATYLFNLIVSHFTDGERFTALTEIDGVPKLQPIPSHRVGSRSSAQDVVESGPFAGQTIIDGVIVNEWGGTLGYRVYHSDSSFTNDDFTDVSLNDIVPSFIPYSDEQLRGISLLGTSCFNWQDAAEFKRFEMLQQKLASTRALIEENETGDVDTAKTFVTPASPGVDIDRNAQSVASEKIDGIVIQRFRAGQGCKLTPYVSDRPTENQRNFIDGQIREALAGVGWSFDFSLDPTKIGGAPLRVVIDKVEASLTSLRKFLVEPTCRRIDGWRVSKAIKDGRLTPNSEWYKWSYQGPRKLTADRKYDSDVDIQERRAGLSTLRRGTASRGAYWRDERAQQDVEVHDLLTRSQATAKKFGIPIEVALSLYELITPNGNLPVGAIVDNEPPRTD